MPAFATCKPFFNLCALYPSEILHLNQAVCDHMVFVCLCFLSEVFPTVKFLDIYMLKSQVSYFIVQFTWDLILVVVQDQNLLFLLVYQSHILVDSSFPNQQLLCHISDAPNNYMGLGLFTEAQFS